MSAWHETSSADYQPSDPKKRTNFMEMFPPLPQPDTEMRRYRLLSPSAGVRVSPICLGAMSLGDQWTGLMANKLDQKESEEYLDYYYNAGGNFIDTGEWSVSLQSRNTHAQPITTKTSSPSTSLENGWRRRASETRLSSLREWS